MTPYEGFRVSVRADWAQEVADVFIWRPAGDGRIEKVSTPREEEGEISNIFEFTVMDRGQAMADNEPTLRLPVDALTGLRDELDRMLGARESKETVKALEANLAHERGRVDKVLEALLKERIV